MTHAPISIIRALLLAAACALLLTGCGTMQVSTPDPSPKGGTIVNTARTQLGKSYRYGGASPRQGFDCSGLVYWAYQTNGIKVPRNTQKQASAGYPVKRSQAAPGDILVFRTGIMSLHTGLYAGNNTFIHSPSRGKRVRMESMDAAYWRKKLVAVRRVAR